jgi:hypothetical protein
MRGKTYGKLLVIRYSGKKQGPHKLYYCHLDDGTAEGQYILVRGNNLRDRGYSGKPLRRAA